MLSKENRLKKKKDFEKVFKKGRGVNQDFLFLKFQKNNIKESRFGFLVSQKISKKAVIRNKIKRRLRGLINSNLSKIKKGNDIILVTRPGLEKNDFQSTKEMINTILKKANLFND